MTSWETWAAGVLNGLGAPLNQTNVDTLFAWSSAETDPYPLMRWNNPLDTTQPEGAGNVDANSVGVKIYPTVEQGIAATVTTLLNGYYPLIVAHLRNSVPRAQWGDACAELGTWGTGCGWITRDYGLAPQELLALTAEQDALLRNIYNLLMVGLYQAGNAATEGYAMKTLLPAIKGIASPPPATVDLSAVLTALATLQTEVADIKAKVDKDLA